ncbi:GroES-like protein [Trametes elegans]|nr:GroES-like protein [Trametes elegans]
MSTPSQQKALVLEYKQGPLVLKQIDVPKPGPEEVLLRIDAAALNPADWKIQTLGIIIQKYPTIPGFDAAGTIVEVGSAVEDYAVNDRVIFQGWYDPEDFSGYGVFREYVVAPLEVIAKFPANISVEEASTISSGLATAAFPLYNEAEGAPSIKLSPPWEERGLGKYAGKPIFILGGATSIGQYLIQLARLSGFSPIVTTASLKNSALLKSLGATHVLDRTLSTEALSAQARALAGGADFEIVYDAISEPETLAPAYAVTAPTGTLVKVLYTPIPGVPEEELKTRVLCAHGLFKTPINRAVSASLLAKLPELLASGTIKPNRPELLPGGLRGVEAGLARLRNNQVSAVKLVVRPPETE